MSFKEKLSVLKRTSKKIAETKSLDGVFGETKTLLGYPNDEAMTGMVTGFIAIAILIAIGLIILASVSEAMPTVANTSAYYGLQSTVETTTVSSYGLLVIVLIIIGAAAVMGAVQLIRGGRQ